MRRLILFFSFTCLIAENSFGQNLCNELFETSPRASVFKINSLQQIMALFTLHTGEKLTPQLIEQISNFETLERATSKFDILNRFNLQKYISPDGKVKIRWRETDLSDPDKASDALVKFSELVAMQQYSAIRKQRPLFSKIRKYPADLIRRIEHELYMKVLLEAEGHFNKSYRLSFLLPWRFLDLEKLHIDSKMIQILNEQGLAAFHKVVVRRYGWRIATTIISKTSRNIVWISSAVSIAYILYLLSKGDDYFDKNFDFETGLEGEDFKLFEKLIKKSGSKSERSVLEWLNLHKGDDPEINSFVQQLNQEFK